MKLRVLLTLGLLGTLWYAWAHDWGMGAMLLINAAAITVFVWSLAARLR